MKYNKIKLKQKSLITAIIGSCMMLSMSGCSGDTEEVDQEENTNTNNDNSDNESNELPPTELPPVGETTGGHNPEGLPNNTPVVGGGEGKDTPVPDSPEGLPPMELPPIGEPTEGHNPEELGADGNMPERPMTGEPEKP